MQARSGPGCLLTRSERYLARARTATTPDPGQVGAACHQGYLEKAGGWRVVRSEAGWPVRINSVLYDQCRAFDRRLRTGAGDRARGGRRAVRGAAGRTAGRGRELDRMAVLAPGPGAGRSRGRRVRGGTGVARVHRAVRAAVRAGRDGLRAQLGAGGPGPGLGRLAYWVLRRGARADRRAGVGS